MTSDLKEFRSRQFGALRVTDRDGDLWFVAKDVCDALGIATNHLREEGRGLDYDEVSTLPHWEGKGASPLIVSEAGLYSLVMRSRKPEAKEFRRWVTHEVIPSIRRTGGYMVARKEETPEQTMSRALLIAKEALDRRDARIAELEPKALFADAVAASDGTCLVGELAKMLRQNGVQVGQNRLFKRLRDDGFLGKSGQNYNVPTQYAIERGLFRVKETSITHSDGHVTITRTPKVTGKGQVYFIRRYSDQTEEKGI